jgi:hypothetical protein
MMRRIAKKIWLMLDNKHIITTEETLLDTENAKMTKLIRAGRAINYAMLDREKRDENELVSMKKELDHVCHQAEYYQNSTRVVVLLKSEFRETYAHFTIERNLFSACIDDFQEDTLMGMETCKDVQRWYEKAHQAFEQIDYINTIHKGQDREEHDIRVLMDNNIS